MTTFDALPYDAPLAEYEARAESLLRNLQAGESAAVWKFKWLHPRYRGKPVTEVTADLSLDDARLVLARDFSFEDWQHVAEFVQAVSEDGPVADFEKATEAVVSGDVPTLRAMLSKLPELVRARSTRRHHATLLHYIAANGVEEERQKTPANAVEVARLILEGGAEVDALADMYDQKCTTMGLLVSSCHPAEAGLQIALAETLLDYGAALDEPATRWQSPIITALAFGYSETAHRLAARAAPPDDLAIAAGLGRIEDAARLLASADAETRHVALALAAQHGHVVVVSLLLDTGEDPNRYNPEGFHSHSTPLHQAVFAGRLNVVKLLIDRGARFDIRDALHQGTPLDWAIYGKQDKIAEFLRSKGARPK